METYLLLCLANCCKKLMQILYKQKFIIGDLTITPAIISQKTIYHI